MGRGSTNPTAVAGARNVAVGVAGQAGAAGVAGSIGSGTSAADPPVTPGVGVGVAGTGVRARTVVRPSAECQSSG